MLCNAHSNHKPKKIGRIATDFGYNTTDSVLYNNGKTSGSRVMFSSDVYKTKILLHKPHPRKELLEYQIKQLITQLLEEGLL